MMNNLLVNILVSFMTICAFAVVIVLALFWPMIFVGNILQHQEWASWAEIFWLLTIASYVYLTVVER